MDRIIFMSCAVVQAGYNAETVVAGKVVCSVASDEPVAVPL